MKNTTRLVVNTVTTYGRSLLTLFFVLFSSRWVLAALGAVDYGLFSLVGSLIVFLAFFNSVMASSSARHFAYSIGKGDIEDVNKWFNTSLYIHLILPAILIIIGWPIGEYVIRHELSIPLERIDACIVVFQISLIGAYVNMASIPLIAMFTAKQKLVEIALWGVLESFLVFILALYLKHASSNHLVVYAAGMVGINSFVKTILTVRAFRLFPECHLRLKNGFNIARLKELLRFAGWNMIGIFGRMLRDQGSAILLNRHFGPASNAAFGIAKKLSAQVNQLSAAMMNALVPEITSREGSGERARMLRLAHLSCKYSFLLVLLFAAPLIIEMDYVLKLWLINPPEYTAVLCRLILGTYLLRRLSAGYPIAVNALGRMAGFHSTIGGLLIMTLPLAWLFLRLGYPPSSLGVAYMFIGAMCSIGSVYWIKILFDEPVRYWINKVLVPAMIVAAISLLSALYIQHIMMESFLRLVLVSTNCLTTIAFGTWFFALSKRERTYFQNASLRIYIRCRKIFNRKNH